MAPRTLGRMYQWWKFVAGSAAVYLAMAACSAGKHGADPVAERGGTATATETPTPTAGGAGLVEAPSEGAGGLMGSLTEGGMMGAIVDPVPDAGAQEPATPLPPMTADRPCDKTTTTAAYPYHYAEQAYPGRSAVELAGVIAMAHQASTAPAGYDLPPGYEHRIIPTYVRDGAVAAYCQLSNQAGELYDHVTFIGP